MLLKIPISRHVDCISQLAMRITKSISWSADGPWWAIWAVIDAFKRYFKRYSSRAARPAWAPEFRTYFGSGAFPSSPKIVAFWGQAWLKFQGKAEKGGAYRLSFFAFRNLVPLCKNVQGLEPGCSLAFPIKPGNRKLWPKRSHVSERVLPCWERVYWTVCARRKIRPRRCWV